jgi:acyl carrier protein
MDGRIGWAFVGLDIVELVMEVEEEFSIAIPDGLAATLTTVGKLHAAVVAELHRLDRPLPPEEVFERIRGIVSTQLGVPPEQVVEGARFVEDFGAD